MIVSVVVRTRNEADRLRLTLASLAAQSVEAELVVVNDGSTDHTNAVLTEAAGRMALTVVLHGAAQGRSAASNAGAQAARGDILLFLDGDVLAAPDLVASHAALHQAGSDRIGRGDTRHLRSTRFFRDPALGIPFPDNAARLSGMPRDEREQMRVTREMVEDDFTSLEARAEPGIYPGAAPRRLYEMEMDALRNHPDCPVLWAAASGHNLSVCRHAFVSCGAFDPALTINEHRELALRLCRRGSRMVPVEARTLHMTHRAGWRDPLRERDWEAVFWQRHRDPAIPLLVLFWASLSGIAAVPPACRILSLPDLAKAARNPGNADFPAAREALFAAVAGRT